MAIKNLKINKECIVRDRPCGRVFNCSNTCFIACASSDQVGFELDLIKDCLLNEEIEPYVAVDNFVPAKDIFCTKICTKIIESKFCIVLLSGITDSNNTVLPNSNVYYEYGLMTSWHKYIIPILREDQKLSFNIQSLDTIKYSPSNFKTKLNQAIILALSSTGMTETKENQVKIEDLLVLYFEVNGFSPLNKCWISEKTQFLPFQNFNFGRIIYTTSDFDRTIFELKVMIVRMERYSEQIDKNLIGLNKSLEKAETENQIEGIKKQINKSNKIKDGLLAPKFIIIVMQIQFKEELIDRLVVTDSIIKPDFSLISYDEMAKEIEIMR
ncbi:MAG: hypothetical protein JXA54_03365 [Candidatus Heimdallarchaeota archaeon]|nr:hypothetical protein [Candidatus Heimdallarchaeota archaeon]